MEIQTSFLRGLYLIIDQTLEGRRLDDFGLSRTTIGTIVHIDFFLLCSNPDKSGQVMLIVVLLSTIIAKVIFL